MRETKAHLDQDGSGRRRVPPGPSSADFRSYQSFPSTSPEAGVVAANQVGPLIAPFTKRTLPSPSPHWMPPVWGDTARHMHTLAAPPQVHGVVFVWQKDGAGWIIGV